MIGLLLDAIRITVMIIVGIALLPLLIIFPFALG